MFWHISTTSSGIVTSSFGVDPCTIVHSICHSLTPFLRQKHAAYGQFSKGYQKISHIDRARSPLNYHTSRSFLKVRLCAPDMFCTLRNSVPDVAFTKSKEASSDTPLAVSVEAVYQRLQRVPGWSSILPRLRSSSIMSPRRDRTSV
jgi:hypothetical protein